MKKQVNVIAWFFALSLMSASGVAHALFEKGMNPQQIAVEMGAQFGAGATLEMVASGASAAGLNPEEVTLAMINAGQYPAAVVTAMIQAFPQDQISIAIAGVKAAPNQAASILGAAIAAAPKLTQAITTAVLVLPGVNPAAVLAATAAGVAPGAESTPLMPAATPRVSGGGGRCRGRNCPASPA
ncbi:MAG: hypothetical protein WA632_08530 [Gallionella sp.]